MVLREQQVSTHPETVLVVDDDKHIVQLVSLYLSKAGFRVVSANDSAEALRIVRQLSPDLLVLDIMLPGPDGFEVCRVLRRSSEVPIVILSARGSDLDKVAGLQFGADDYITKPFNPAELVARVQSVMRRSRSRGVAPTRSRISLGKLCMDLDQRIVTVAELPLQLRPKEFDLLSAFARLPGFVLDRDRLLDLVWGSEFAGDQRTVDVHVAWLREKLQGSELRIQTVWGVGYKLVVEDAP
ncbi:MAG TPA: response regulator transcription factor [Dehalococcoidia bacterium]|nr:response regulator transcription factor [Dehalococcoidia bacterium]